MSTALHLFPQILACPTCMGDPGTKSSMAQSNAIVFMLVLLACVLSTFIYTIISFGRKQQKALAREQK